MVMQAGQQRHLTGGLLLVSVAVAGLLSMHGFDPLLATVHETHATHIADTEAGLNDHGPVGLCVFVAAVAGLALVTVRRLQGSTRGGSSTYRFRRIIRPDPVAASGPLLLHRLCVLRL